MLRNLSLHGLINQIRLALNNYNISKISIENEKGKGSFAFGGLIWGLGLGSGFPMISSLGFSIVN
jgi:hypothetical protein